MDDMTVRRPDRARPEPLWHQTEQALRELIDRGSLKDGDQLPPEPRLLEMLGISRITLRDAMRRLEEAGLVRREHGRGTFVRKSTVVAGTRGLTSFTDEMARMGETLGTRLCDAAELPAPPPVADALGLPDGATVTRLRRLRLGGDRPIGVQTAFLESARVPGLIDEAEQIVSLYRTLEARYGIVPRQALERYRATAIDPPEAALLGLAPGNPALMVERTTHDARGPFEFVQSTMHPDRYEIRATLTV